MEERKIKELFQQTGESLQAIFEYFKLKNRVLFEGNWVSGSKTITGIGKYQVVQIWSDLGSDSWLVSRRGDRFLGGGVISYPTWFATQEIVLSKISENSATIYSNYWVAHNPNSSHGAMNKTYGIRKIVGIEPMVPEELLKIIGGGYCLICVLFRLKGGAWHEIVCTAEKYSSKDNKFISRMVFADSKRNSIKNQRRVNPRSIYYYATYNCKRTSLKKSSILERICDSSNSGGRSFRHSGGNHMQSKLHRQGHERVYFRAFRKQYYQQRYVLDSYRKGFIVFCRRWRYANI